MVSPVPFFYINGKYYTNGTYTVTLPVNINFDSLYYVNGSARMVLEGVKVDGVRYGSSFAISEPGTSQITANYITQCYVTVNLNVSAYVNGVEEALTSGWYDAGTMIQVYPQIVQVGQYEIYNITTPYSFIVNGPESIQVSYRVLRQHSATQRNDSRLVRKRAIYKTAKNSLHERRGVQARRA